MLYIFSFSMHLVAPNSQVTVNIPPLYLPDLLPCFVFKQAGVHQAQAVVKQLDGPLRGIIWKLNIKLLQHQPFVYLLLLLWVRFCGSSETSG